MTDSALEELPSGRKKGKSNMAVIKFHFSILFEQVKRDVGKHIKKIKISLLLQNIKMSAMGRNHGVCVIGNISDFCNDPMRQVLSTYS